MKRILALIVVLTVFLSGCGKDKGAELINSIDLSKQSFTFTDDYRGEHLDIESSTYTIDPVSKTGNIKIRNINGGATITVEVNVTEDGIEPVSFTQFKDGRTDDLKTLDPKDVDNYIKNVMGITSFDSAQKYVQESLDIIKRYFKNVSTLQGDRYIIKYDVKDGGKTIGSCKTSITEDGKKVEFSYNALGQGRQEYTITLD